MGRVAWALGAEGQSGEPLGPLSQNSPTVLPKYHTQGHPLFPTHMRYPVLGDSLNPSFPLASTTGSSLILPLS